MHACIQGFRSDRFMHEYYKRGNRIGIKKKMGAGASAKWLWGFSSGHYPRSEQEMRAWGEAVVYCLHRGADDKACHMRIVTELQRE